MLCRHLYIGNNLLIFQDLFFIFVNIGESFLQRLFYFLVSQEIILKLLLLLIKSKKLYTELRHKQNRGLY